MDQLSAYGHHPDPLYYVTRFMDGLKPAVRLMVAIQMPEDLDKAYQLALLHEELGDGYTPLNAQNTVKRASFPGYNNSPPQVNRTVDKVHTVASKSSMVDDRWAALRNFRKAKGLCYTCGEKWGKEHKCQGTVQLHVVQEMVELL
jgi:hypothetical protein